MYSYIISLLSRLRGRSLPTARGSRSEPLTASAPGADFAELYLDLLKRSILNEIYLDDELRIAYLRACLAGTDSFNYAVLHDIRTRRNDQYVELKRSREIGQFVSRNIANSGFSHSMIGRARMDSLHQCLDIIRQQNIPGDLVECGVWRGGSCIFMAGYLRAHDLDRRVVVADSFEGLPVPSLPREAKLNLSKEIFPELAVSLDTVKENFSVYGLDGDNVVYVKGWFKDSLPHAPVNKIALLRLDGDLYESTMDVLNAMYDKVVPGGIIVIDDYGLKPCREAVHDFFDAGGFKADLRLIDWTGAWFQKHGT